MRAYFVATLLLLAQLFSPLAWSELQGRNLSYQLAGESFNAYLARDDRFSGKRPAVLVVHEWWGLNDYARRRADMLAEQGYVAMAVDMYGAGKLAQHPDDAKGFMQAVTSNMAVAEQRFRAAKALLLQQADVDGDKLAAIGYCFGGAIVLHMARQGEELLAVASFHGSLTTQTPAQPQRVKAKVLVFNGADDPYISPEHIADFKQEMTVAGVDYQFHNYPGALHGFSNPGATALGQRFNMPLAYDEASDSDSWQRTLAIFRDLFARH